jgi:hypothetical protein
MINDNMIAKLFSADLPVVPILFAVVIVLAFLVSRHFDAKRRKTILDWARSHRLTFSEAKDHRFCNRYPEYLFLQQGENYYAHNTLTGLWNGRPFLGFDYHYETHSHNSKGGRQTQHHFFSAVVIPSDIILNPLTLRPEGVFDKITEFFGYDDIDFESAEFSRRFYVTSTDKRWAYDVIHPRMMEFLLAAPRFNIQFGFKSVIAYKNSRFSTEDYAAAADLISGILDRFPVYLIQQQKEGLSDGLSA